MWLKARKNELSGVIGKRLPSQLRGGGVLVNDRRNYSYPRRSKRGLLDLVMPSVVFSMREKSLGYWCGTTFLAVLHSRSKLHSAFKITGTSTDG